MIFPELRIAYQASGDAFDTTVALFETAAASTLDAAAAVRAQANADIRRSYLLVGCSRSPRSWVRCSPTASSHGRCATCGRRPTISTATPAAPPITPSGPSEVRAALAAIRTSSLHLDLVTRQARALSRGDLDDASLDETAPGGLGTAVHDAVGTLRTALTQQEEFRRRLAHEAAHDGLTNLPNRNASMAQLTRSLARTQRADAQLAVLFVDLDRFKEVNDQNGHGAGDHVLRTVAQRLVANVREGDHVGRLGGDEFVVVAEPVDDIEDAVELAERLVDALSEPIDIGPARVNVGASVGVAMSQSAPLDADEMLRDADLAVYRAKELGRGGVFVCDEALRQEMLESADLSSAIARAIEDDEFLMHYQAIVDSSTKELRALEALVRWQRPGEERLVPPDQFITFAERTGLVVDIDRWVIETVIRQVAAWHSEGRFLGVPVAINVSGQHVNHHDVVGNVLEPLARHGVDPTSIVVEITESALLEDLVTAAGKLEQLRAAGVLIAIDDFGTGYTSLAHLRSLPVDILKIDRSFTMNAAKTDREASIVKLIIDTGHLLGASITAEGVETLVEVDELTRLGSDKLQGYFFARPVPAAELTTLFGHLLTETISTPPRG